MMKTPRLWLIWVGLLMGLAVTAACGGAAPSANENGLDRDLSPTAVDDLRTAEEVTVIDVREDWEYAAGHLPNVTHIPMGAIADRVNEIPTDRPVVVYCRSGNRSNSVTQFLRDNGYDNVHNMSGGITAWEQAGLPIEQ